jgi:hypothetical protein
MSVTTKHLVSEVARLTAALAEVTKDRDFARELLAKALTRVVTLECALPLARLGRAVLTESRPDTGPGDVDGGWLQEEAERLGLLARKFVNGGGPPGFCGGCGISSERCECLWETDAAAALGGEAGEGAGDA